uniref:Uncharacterized protein n=1 Tax=Rhizophora mucronata TaxID=61149 RepID=A0A2P2PVW4_RHIMU
MYCYICLTLFLGKPPYNKLLTLLSRYEFLFHLFCSSIA